MKTTIQHWKLVNEDRSKVKARRLEQTKGEMRRAITLFLTTIKASGLASEYIFFSVPNRKGVQFNPRRADLTITLTLNAISWPWGMIDRSYPWCQGGSHTPPH